MAARDMPVRDAAAIVASYRSLLTAAIALPDPDVTPATLTVAPVRADGRPCVLIFSPHPDDECLTGGLPLRMRDSGWRVVNLAVTLGSDKARRAARLDELRRACGVLDFEIVLAREDGLDAVRADTREQEPELWHGMIRRVAAIIAALRPTLIVMPHGDDGHPAHGGTFLLGQDALAAQDAGFSCHVALSEYWQALAEPNLLIGIDDAGAARLLSAVACHVGENARNPFDVRFPAYLIDNVRRGAERVGGAGQSAPVLDFAMLYQLGIWRNGRIIPSALRRTVAPDQGIASLFDL